MSTKFEKSVAERELMERRRRHLENKIKTIKKLSDTELEHILAEPDEDEPEVEAQ